MEGATTENATGSASVNGKTRTSQGSKPRSVSANCKESKEGKSTMSETKSRKNASQGDKDERGVEGATTENATGSASVNGKTRTSQGSKPRSVSVSSSRKSAKGSTSG